MDFMSILGRCLLLPFPVAMFIGCLLSQADDRFFGMLMSVVIGWVSWHVTRPKRQKTEVA
ncbi:hypothetical protein R497_24255 [Salmonella enterica subsp. enterica serovar Havana]|nr:hypothetical protein [Salmonella enterica subsp. enterica serovar Havana]EDD4392948.1 hypothetical protein [Salmonella enterica]HEC7541175.1 hypothetical protein [Salmonella enterica subsp. enterica serovar Oranienburg]HEC8366947.1 hypothetical protein [Salmonella enterica subsp. enterica serovar Javiana]ECU7061980.1 hypothetical protein [Salmonella enterica subsp. enterica serovar Havana]